MTLRSRHSGTAPVVARVARGRWSGVVGIGGQPPGGPWAGLARGLLAFPAGRGQGAAGGVAAGPPQAAGATSPARTPARRRRRPSRGHTVVRVVTARLRWSGAASGRPARAGRVPGGDGRARDGRPRQPGLPRRWLRGRRHRRGRRAVPAADGRGPRGGDRPGAPAGRPAAGVRGLAGAGDGDPGRAAPLGTSHRPPQRRGGAHPLAGRHHHPLLRREPVHRAADRGRTGGQLGQAPDRAVPVNGRSRAAPGPVGDRAPGAGRTRRRAGRGGRVPPGESFGISLLAAARKPSAACEPGPVSPSGPG